MEWSFFKKHEFLTRAEVIRRTHERWLTRALKSGRDYPRIPIRPVSQGGFSSLMENPAGRLMARAWWDAALEHVTDAPGMDSEQ